jgi:NAD(P)-dependent dehydrogenase (short-subunit alcohol dehydrogenase family)
MENLFDVKGKVIVITGGAGILGRGMAEYMAAQGCKVVILDRGDAGIDLVEKLKSNGADIPMY